MEATKSFWDSKAFISKSALESGAPPLVLSGDKEYQDSNLDSATFLRFHQAWGYRPHPVRRLSMCIYIPCPPFSEILAELTSSLWPRPWGQLWTLAEDPKVASMR